MIQELFIGGTPTPARSGRSYEKISPVTGDVVSRAAAADPQDVDAAVAAAELAYPAWAALPAEERVGYLLRAADLLEERAGQIAGVMTEELGATVGWGHFNCALAAGILRSVSSLPAEATEVELGSGVPGLDARAVRRPLGVVVGIAPWNAPIILATRAIAAPLALGNVVILKASEESPRTQGAVVDILRDAGIPAGVISLLTNAPGDGPDVVNALIDHPAVRHINFTGSTEVGRAIAIRSAGLFKRTLLELGGKAPFVVLDDAEVDEAVSAATFGAFMNSGQICMSTERIIVQRGVADPFVERLAARARDLTAGDPRDPAVAVGPVVTAAAATRIQSLIADAVEQGAELLAGGDVDGVNVAPTVVVGVTPAMRIYHEETFGPVVTVSVVDDDEAAIRLANDTAYGLSSAVFGTDAARARAVADRLVTGMCHINGATVHDEPHVPFGGVKDSGWGRFGGSYAVPEFTDLRWLTVHNGNRNYPI
ncbi:aldehyde dehydrogenase [Okibacterium endophyticum]